MFDFTDHVFIDKPFELVNAEYYFTFNIWNLYYYVSVENNKYLLQDKSISLILNYKLKISSNLFRINGG